MSNSEKASTPLERLKEDAAYYERQAAFCEVQITDLEKRGDELDAEANNYRKLARETRVAIKTLEEAANPWLYAGFVAHYAKPAPKYDFKVGQYVTHVTGTNAGYIHSAYVGDNGDQVVQVCHTVRGVEDWYARNIRKS